MAKGSIRQWIMMCLIFSCLTLLWFTVNVQRRNNWFVRQWEASSAGQSGACKDSKTNGTNQRIERTSKSPNTREVLHKLPPKSTISKVVAENSPKKQDIQSTLLVESKLPKPINNGSSEKRVISSTANTGTEGPEAVANGSTAQCSLSWNTIGLNVYSYETENSTIIRPLIRGNKASVKIKPIFQDTVIPLDPDKFLLPVVTWGPNNQLIGLWEGLFVAITLNRTLVLPRFRKHNTDRQWKRGMVNRISPIHRIDAESLCRYVSCVTLDDFQKACDFKVDAILNIRHLKMKQIREIESNIRMKILPEGANGDSPLGEMVVPRNGTSLDKPLLRFNADEIKALFGTPERCVIEPFPFFDLLSHDKSTTLYNRVTKAALTDEKSPSDVRLLANIMKNSQQPKYIRDIAKDFISKEFDGGPYLSAHWRYNEGDYMADWHCNAKEINAKRCAKIRNYTAHDFANRLDQVISQLKGKSIFIGHVYIAAPRSGSSMLASLGQVVKDKKWKILSSVHLENFLKEHYSNCDFVLKHFEDILSSTEMELCSRGVVFLGSLGSSWTGNVHKARIFQEDYDVNDSKDYIFRAR